MVRMIDLVKNKKRKEDDRPSQVSSEAPAAPSGPAEDEPIRLAGLFGQGQGAPPAAPEEPAFSAEPAAPQQAPPARRERTVLEGSAEGAPGLRTPRKLEVRKRYCPYLGGKKNRNQATDFPTATNVCYAQQSREKKLLRTTILPYTIVAAQRQRELCLSSSYVRCPIYQAKEEEEGASS